MVSIVLLIVLAHCLDVAIHRRDLKGVDKRPPSDEFIRHMLMSRPVTSFCALILAVSFVCKKINCPFWIFAV